MAMRLQLVEGIELLDEWAESASQADRNGIYEALFAIGDGSAFLIYDIFGDSREWGGFVVVVKPDLVLKVQLRRTDSAFAIRYVGAPDGGTGGAAPTRDERGRPEGG
jgi:Family of unknown function (DUF6235)